MFLWVLTTPTIGNYQCGQRFRNVSGSGAVRHGRSIWRLGTERVPSRLFGAFHYPTTATIDADVTTRLALARASPCSPHRAAV